MIRDPSPAQDSAAAERDRKAWVEPELDAFPMSETENGIFHVGDFDGLTNDS